MCTSVISSEFTLLLPSNCFCFYLSLFLLIWRVFSVRCLNWGGRRAEKTTVFISFTLQIHLSLCTSRAAHNGKGGSPKAGMVHCLCQQYIPVTVWLCSLCSPSICHSRQRFLLLLCSVDFDLHTYCLPTTHRCRAWTQWAWSPHGHAMSPFVMATEEHMKCVLLVSQIQIFPPGRSHHYSLQKQSTGFMLWWLPSNIRFWIKAEKGGSAEEVTEGLLLPFTSFGWCFLNLQAWAARTFRTLTGALEQRVLFPTALILLWKRTEAPDTLVSVCVTEGRTGVFHLPTGALQTLPSLCFHREHCLGWGEVWSSQSAFTLAHVAAC